jgi:hypothetical protein
MENYQELVDFKNKFGHINVHWTNKKLYHWMKNQRQRSNLPSHREEKLRKLGFDFKTKKEKKTELFFRNLLGINQR